jgi:hypothetical protein
MKKTRTRRECVDRTDIDEILPEYDFSRASRNKYAARYAAGSAVVVLEPDAAAAFPSSGEANEALRERWRESSRSIGRAARVCAAVSKRPLIDCSRRVCRNYLRFSALD